MSKVKKCRVDQLAVERGLFQSRNQAQAGIMAGELFSEGVMLSKPGHLVKEDIPMARKSRRQRYVGRGGFKLEGALKDFHVNVRGMSCIDIGSSTGGFTDCLLQQHADRVQCIDVGKGQLDIKIRNHPQVKVAEGVNARYLKPEDFEESFDLAVIDVSFISLTKILPVVATLLTPRNGKVIALIKPQFEVGPAAIGKGGIVRDKQARDGAVQHVLNCLPDCQLKKINVRPSCIKGTDGNQEFFLLAERSS